MTAQVQGSTDTQPHFNAGNDQSIVAICIPTFMRPKGLTSLLESFQALEIDGFSAHLIVADNDPEGSAREAFQQATRDLPFPSIYIIEPTRGIVAARNRLVTEARKLGADFLASADDDQVADPQWLKELVKAGIAHNADVVASNLGYSFPPDTSKAIRHCFFTRSVPTGTRIRNTGTGGTLYRMSALDAIAGPFDDRLSLAGGSDALLGATLSARGYKLISCNTAHITEVMPKSRLTFRWIARRAWREGQSRSRLVKWVNPSRSKSIKQTILFAGYIVKNGFMIVPDIVRYRTAPLRRIRLMIFGFSGLKAMTLGSKDVQEYVIIHGE